MRHLSATIAALALAIMAIAVPASADDVEFNQPCTNTAGRTVVTIDSPFSDVVDTPVGALESETLPAGTGAYVIDLRGMEVGERRNVNLTLTMDTAGLTAIPVSDYDLIVNGENDLSTDQPEIKSVDNARHCQIVNLETTVFTGTPLDVLTLDVQINNFTF